jgi:hypothetical protein
MPLSCLSAVPLPCKTRRRFADWGPAASSVARCAARTDLDRPSAACSKAARAFSRALYSRCAAATSLRRAGSLSRKDCRWGVVFSVASSLRAISTCKACRSYVSLEIPQPPRAFCLCELCKSDRLDSSPTQSGHRLQAVHRESYDMTFFFSSIAEATFLISLSNPRSVSLAASRSNRTRAKSVEA